MKRAFASAFRRRKEGLGHGNDSAGLPSRLRCSGRVVFLGQNRSAAPNLAPNQTRPAHRAPGRQRIRKMGAPPPPCRSLFPGSRRDFVLRRNRRILFSVPPVLEAEPQPIASHTPIETPAADQSRTVCIGQPQRSSLSPVSLSILA